MRALIIEDGLSRQALAAARSLAAAGWEVGIGSPDTCSVAAASRSVGAWHRVEGVREGMERFASGVEAAVAAGAYQVVFGARDDEMAALAALGGRLGARVAHPALPILATVLDKLELARVGAEAGFAVPRTIEPDGSLPAGSAWMVKPRVGRALARAVANGDAPPERTETRPVGDEAELGEAIAELEAAGEDPLLQERVEGRLIALVVLAGHDHSIVRCYQQRSELSWPLDAGISVRARVVETDPDLAERAAALVAALGWTGLAQLQMLEPPGGDPRLIDFNGRFFGSLALARAAGCDVASAWAKGTLDGSMPDPGPARVGTRYQWAWGDLRRATQARTGGLARDVLGVLRYAPGAAHSLFDPRDPRPAIRYARVQGGRAGRRRTSRAGTNA